jgi:SAM-dependent methyltransferase/thymidylate kinase
MRIELLGPSGVGKTTTLAAAIASSAPRMWLAPDELATLYLTPTADDLRAALDDPAHHDFAAWFISLVADTDMRPSQKVSAMTILRRSCYDVAAIEALALSRLVVHDELLLHRAFSLLPRVDDVEAATHEYFTRVSLPDAAVIVTADPEIILRRATARGQMPNVYRNLDPNALATIIAKAHRVAEIAAKTLADRGLPVLELDTTTDPHSTAARLNAFITAQEPTMPNDSDDIRERLLSASGSFRKKAGRHELRTKDVMYCAFSTPDFTVTPEESQRDATKRVAAFRLTREQVEGRTVLDLGSNAGAMLFEISNFKPAAGYGIEYDADKVDLANEIADLADIEHLRFAQGDIDELDPAKVGVHDIVFALAIEAHVQKPERLYELLGQVTGDLLCFEGNSTCDMDAVRTRLTEAGFGDFVDLGFCQDDRDPRNNTRPQMLARKVPRKRGLVARLRRLRNAR